MDGPARREETKAAGRALVGELRAPGERVVHDEARLVGEDRAKDAGRRRRLDGPVEHLAQIGDGQMHAPVGRVARRRDGGRVGHPHRGGARAEAEQEPVARARGGDHFFVAPPEAQAP